MPTREERSANRKKHLTAISKSGIDYTVHNDGAHVKLHNTCHGTIDFWPGTEKWWAGETQRKGNGFPALMEYINRKPSTKAFDSTLNEAIEQIRYWDNASPFEKGRAAFDTAYAATLLLEAYEDLIR